MPLYEYQCDACAHRFEVIQKFSDAPIDVCPKCGGTVQKLLSSPAIQFKGSGWYITDYARAGKSDSANVAPGKTDGTKTEGATGEGAKAESGKSESGPSADSASGAKTEAKTAPKPSAAPPSD
jgi:putative FmdB family regulatory protein